MFLHQSPMIAMATIAYRIPTCLSRPKSRILTGDIPTGRLHLGHYVGSVENRLAMQDQYDCYFIIATSTPSPLAQQT
jgi:hypothetical protein